MSKSSSSSSGGGGIINKPYILAILISAATAAAISGILFHIIAIADERQFKELDELNDKHAALDKEMAVLEERIRNWEGLNVDADPLS